MVLTALFIITYPSRDKNGILTGICSLCYKLNVSPEADVRVLTMLSVSISAVLGYSYHDHY